MYFQWKNAARFRSGSWCDHKKGGILCTFSGKIPRVSGVEAGEVIRKAVFYAC